MFLPCTVLWTRNEQNRPFKSWNKADSWRRFTTKRTSVFVFVQKMHSAPPRIHVCVSVAIALCTAQSDFQLAASTGASACLSAWRLCPKTQSNSTPSSLPKSQNTPPPRVLKHVQLRGLWLTAAYLPPSLLKLPHCWEDEQRGETVFTLFTLLTPLLK